jgi:hypothetical protein
MLPTGMAAKVFCSFVSPGLALLQLEWVLAALLGILSSGESLVRNLGPTVLTAVGFNGIAMVTRTMVAEITHSGNRTRTFSVFSPTYSVRHSSGEVLMFPDWHLVGKWHGRLFGLAAWENSCSRSGDSSRLSLFYYRQY